jgi:hypothetical protein
VKKLIKYLLLLASSVIFGTRAVMAADPVRDTTSHRVNGYCDGVSTAPLPVTPGVMVPHDIIAMSHGDLKKTSMENVSVGDTRTLAWNPGLHRYNCAEWWMVFFWDDPNTVAIQLEYNGTRIRTQERVTREGTLLSTTTRMTRSDTAWFYAISRNDRSETAVLTSYSYSTGSGCIDCQVFAIIPMVISLPGCTCSPADLENDGLAENKSVLTFDFNKMEV